MESGNAVDFGLLVAHRAGWCTISCLTTSNGDLLLVISPCWTFGFLPCQGNLRLDHSVELSFVQSLLFLMVAYVLFALFICLPCLLRPQHSYALSLHLFAVSQLATMILVL
jgi:hypothetical protein